MTRLTLLGVAQPAPDDAASDEVVSLEELRARLHPSVLPQHAMRYSSARYMVTDIDRIPLAAKASLGLRPFTRGPITIEDRRGQSVAADAVFTTKATALAAGETISGRTLKRRHAAAVERLDALPPLPTRIEHPLQTPYYLRTDLVIKPVAGGAVAHTSGILNALTERSHRPPRFLSASTVPLISDDVVMDIVTPAARFLDDSTLPRMLFDTALLRRIRQRSEQDPASFVYHRHSAFSLAGPFAAHHLGVPLVLEYNGSEVWIAQNWGDGMPDADQATAAEEAVLRAASRVVVVSSQLAEDALAKGVREDRIVVCPNGVDTSRYTPATDGSPVRNQYGLAADDVVVGFVGSFGAWHGAEVLADAFAQARQQRPGLRLLLVGDGLRAADTRRRLEEGGAADAAVWAGMVPQAQTPGHLAACDILVAPHVEPPDGSEFFGSPTKLFEYMAVGKPIVSSALAQLGEVIHDDVNGLSVPPGDVSALAGAIVRLADNAALQQRLGERARADAVTGHSWTQRMDLILDHLASSPTG